MERKEGLDQIAIEGHRTYVGGRDHFWEKVGQLQFDFLCQNGLTAQKTLVDIGCGSLRGGRFFIEYLDEKNYLGLDKDISLIVLGVASELGTKAYIKKKPEFVVSEKFEFNRFSLKPDMGLAQSLFTHLTLPDIYLCLKNLSAWVGPEFTAYITFFETQEDVKNPDKSHSHACFFYSQKQMHDAAVQAGFVFKYIGDWGHPRNQRMFQITRV